MPAVVCLINSTITNAVLDPRMLLTLQTVGDAYVLTNFIHYYFTGEIIYAFMAWDKWWGLPIVIAMQFVFSGMFVGFAKLDTYLKGEREDFDLSFLTGRPVLRISKSTSDDTSQESTPTTCDSG